MPRQSTATANNKQVSFRTGTTNVKPVEIKPEETLDFDPFLDDSSNDIPALVTGMQTSPEALQNICFTITDIAEEPQTDDTYHFFKWRIFIKVRDTGQECSFLMNPSKRRNKLIEQLGKALPVHNMTLVQKTFIEQQKYKLVTYYELANYSEYSGTLSH